MLIAYLKCPYQNQPRIKEKSEYTSREGSAISNTNVGAIRLIPSEHPVELSLVSETIHKIDCIFRRLFKYWVKILIFCMFSYRIFI